MKSEDIQKITKELKEKFPEVGIESIDVDETSGKSTFYLRPTKKTLAFLDNQGAVIPKQYQEKAAVINRDAINRSNLDLLRGVADAYTETPINAFKRAIKYYFVNPLVGSSVDLLSALTCKGFENDIDDDKIKQFYDVWAFDVDFKQVLDWIALDFFKVGQVITYKVVAKYEPRVSYLSPVPGTKIKKPSKKSAGLETAAKKNIWSKGHLPIAYTVLNPTLTTIEGNLLFDKVSVKITLPQELTGLLKKPKNELTENEKDLIKSLPADLKRAAEKGGEYQLDSRLIGIINYRKQPYERYSRPRIGRIFDALEYKRQLQEADTSTLDGISNYILKVTIGNDEYPVTQQEELTAVANLFNTTSKSFDVVWNHTLQIEKIVSPEIEAILGQDKYKQVNEDITGGLSIPRMMLDGVGELGTAESQMVSKSISELVTYARNQIEGWIYMEYRQIAETMGFDRFPKIRWDEGILKDPILYMNTLAALVDRRMISYKTALEELGYDYPNEANNMKSEFDLVQSGIFGIIGSPWQQAKTQPSQGAPTGSPSQGRPKGQTNTKTKETAPSAQRGQKPNQKLQDLKKKAASLKIIENIPEMTAKQYAAFLDGAKEILNEDEFAVFLDNVSKVRFGV